MWICTVDICFAALALYLVVRLITRSVPLPPGPPTWPLLGNLLDLRADVPYKTFGSLSRKYGHIVSLRVLGTQLIVLNSFKATRDLLEKESGITSNRPHFMVANDLVGWGNATGFLQYGNIHRKHRKFIGKHVRSNHSLIKFHSAEEAEAKWFARSVLKNPEDLIVLCRRTAASLILKISHGYSVEGNDDPIMTLGEKAVHNISEMMTPGRFLADFLPILRYLPEWFPGAGFLKDARQWRKVVSESVNMPFDFVLEHLAKGDAVPSVTSQLVQSDLTLEDEEILKWSSYSMYMGGSETTPSVLSAFFLAMIMYPEILKKGQAEVDGIVGKDRLPTMEDRAALPYVNAICMELLRWHVVVPLPSHVNTQDIIYEGYLIPKGSWLLPNVWFILNDPETYPDPDVFDPERFLGNNQQPDPREACFGWGRRQCLGSRLAESMIFIFVVTALATMDMLKYIENGVECMPKRECEEGMIRHVKPFRCRIVPRSKEAEDILHA